MKTIDLIKVFFLAAILIVFAILMNLQIYNWNEARIEAINDQIKIYKTDEALESQIKQMVDQFFKDGTLNNLDAMDAIHLNTPKFSRVEGSGILSYSKDRELENTFYANRKVFSYNISNHKVDVFDDMAISSFHVDLNAVLGKDTSIINAKASMVFLKNDWDWKVVHKHFSPRN